MNMQSGWSELGQRLHAFLIQAASMLIDCAFLGIWVAAQWALNVLVITRLPVASIDMSTLHAFQIMFAISTFVPVAVYVYVDIRVILLRAKQRIQREVELAGQINDRSR